jgi:hypothetical protein
MNSRLGHRLVAVVGGAALIGLGSLTAACGKSGNEAPSSTSKTPTTTATTAPPSSSVPAPTEKSINPTGGNLFTPSVVAPAAPTVAPGQHPGINGNP